MNIDLKRETEENFDSNASMIQATLPIPSLAELARATIVESLDKQHKFTLSPRHLLQDLFEDATSLYGHTAQLYRLFAGTFSSGGWGSGLIFRIDQSVEDGDAWLPVGRAFRSIFEMEAGQAEEAETALFSATHIYRAKRPRKQLRKQLRPYSVVGFVNGSGLVGSIQAPLRWAVDLLYLQDTSIAGVIDRIVDHKTVRAAFLGGTSIHSISSLQDWPLLTTLMVDLGVLSNPSVVLRELFQCRDRRLRFPSMTHLYLRRSALKAGISVKIEDGVLQRLQFLYIDGPLLFSGMEVVPKVHFGPNYVFGDEPISLLLGEQISADPLVGDATKDILHRHHPTFKTATHAIPFPEWRNPH